MSALVYELSKVHRESVLLGCRSTRTSVRNFGREGSRSRLRLSHTLESVETDRVPNLSRTGRGRRESRAELDRALGARRRELDQAEVVTAGDVGVQPSPQPLIEALGPIDVGHRQHHDLEFHVHDLSSFPSVAAPSLGTGMTAAL